MLFVNCSGSYYRCFIVRNDLVLSMADVYGDNPEQEFEHFGAGIVKPRFKDGLNLRELVEMGSTKFEIDTDVEENFLLNEEDEDIEDVDDSEYPPGREEQLSKEAKQLKVFESVTSDELGSYKELSEKMTNVTEDGLVKKMIIKRGNGIPVPDMAKVYVHYMAFAEGCDEPFDSTILRGSVQVYKLGSPDVVPGFYWAMKSMEVCEVAKFVVNYKYAYGDLGCPPRIPPKADILFKVEMLDFVPADKLASIFCMSPDDRASLEYEKIIEGAQEMKAMGNDNYTQSNYQLAVRRYRKGISLLEEYPVVSEENEMKRNKLLFPLYTNLAQCYLKMGQPAKTCIACRLALRSEPKGKLSKIFYRFAMAKFQLGNNEEAMQLCEKALKSDPKNKSVQILQKKITEKMRLDEVNVKELYKNMLKPPRKDLINPADAVTPIEAAGDSKLQEPNGTQTTDNPGSETISADNTDKKVCGDEE